VGTLAGMTYRAVKGVYTGYANESESTVIPLLGKDPAFTGPAEAIQSSAMRGDTATLGIWCETSAERDLYLALNQTQTVHDDNSDDSDSGGLGTVRDVAVISAKARVGIWVEGQPWWIVELVLRTCQPVESDSGS
jgi:hypothetical protein